MPTTYMVQIDVSGYTTATFTNSVFLDRLPDATGTSSNHYIRYTDATGTLNVTGSTFKANNPPAIDVPVGTKGTRTGNTFLP